MARGGSSPCFLFIFADHPPEVDDQKRKQNWTEEPLQGPVFQYILSRSTLRPSRRTSTELRQKAEDAVALPKDMLEVEIKDHIQQRQHAKYRQGDIFEHCNSGLKSYPGWGNAPPHHFFRLWSFPDHGRTITGDTALA